MQAFGLDVITGIVLGFISFFVYAFGMHMYHTGRTKINQSGRASVICGYIFTVMSLVILVGSPLALLILSPIAFAACVVVGWLVWFKNIKF
jgi:ABC-type antimicrobial peptide transport system permease subunit